MTLSKTKEQPLRYCHLIITTFFLNLAWGPTSAQQYLFDAQLLTTEDGLTNLLISCLHQDPKGFIWIGTQDGLNRYDGYSFKHFLHNEHGLRGKGVYNIAEDDAQNLWLLINQEGKYFCDILNPRTEKIIPLEDYVDSPLPFDTKRLRNMRQVSDENIIWIETTDGTLFLYRNRQFIKITEKLPFDTHKVALDEEGNIWVEGENKLLCFNWSGETLEALDLPNNVFNFWVGKNDRLWISLSSNGYDEGSIWTKAKNESVLNPFLLTKDNQPLHDFGRVIQTKNGFLYVLLNKEIHVFDTNGAWLYNFHDLLGSKMKIGTTSHLDLGEEVFFGTGKGIIKTKIKASTFHLIQDDATSSDFRGITEDEVGNIYFMNNFLHRWNPKNGEISRFTNLLGGSELLYTDNKIWAGTYNPLGHQLDLKSNQHIEYRIPDGHTPRTILASSISNQYYVGHANGICLIDLNNQSTLPFTKYNGFEQLKSLDVRHLYRNKEGIWLATSKGIFFMTEEQGILQHFDKASGHLPFDFINYIYEDDAGIFWLATAGGGLIKWKPVFNSDLPSEATQFTTKDGLSHNNLYAVYSDNLGDLWIPSDVGLMRIHRNPFEVYLYTTRNGLPHNEFNLTSHHQSKDGTLYLGGIGGLITFNPNEIPRKSISRTPLEFTGFQLLEEGAEEMTDLTSSLSSVDEIILSPSHKLIELQFALMDFDDSKFHRYSYQLEGYDNHWRIIDDNHLRITHLPYGDYTLRVKGLNINKGWSEQELELKIRVLKPFYLEWWFIIALLFVGVVLIAGFIKKREINLKKDRERLEAEVKKRTQKIEEDKAIIEAQSEKLQQLDKAKTRFFSNITHEFRTPLTLIIGPVEQLADEGSLPTVFKRRLNGVLNNAKHLLTLINQMLDLSKIESGGMKMEVIKGDIINYTREFVKRFEPLIEKKGHRFKFVSNQESWETHFDKDKWDKIIYNLLSNAFKFTPKGEVVQMSLMKTVFKDKEAIRLDVKDTGVGIKKNHLDQIFNRFYQADDSSRRVQDGTGIGLALVKELVELQGGEIWVSSRVDEGTSFEIYLPVLDYEKGAVEQILELPALPILNEVTEKTAAQSPVSASKKEGKLELLIIEDNEEIREYIQYCLDTSKYNITEAVDGEDGVLKAQSIVPDLIISDVMMPRKNGFEVVKEVREHLATSHIPIILLTAKASLESRLEGLKRGADVYLTKPFSPQELALRIEKLIELRQVLQIRYQNNTPLQEEETYQKEDAFITQLRAYILENIENAELNVDEIGRNFGMSRVHLYRKLKALTNQSTSVLVRQIRLERAKELLQEGKLNISEITYQTGFASVSYFSRSFKKVYGVAPSEM